MLGGISFLNQAIFSLLGFILQTAVFWVPILLTYIAWELRKHYLLMEHLANKKWVLLEIRLPREIFKSPKAMEVILENLNQSYEGNWYKKLFTGMARTWFSLEIVSFEGKVHFFIRCEAIFKNLLEASIYAQYPEVEVYEVPDYIYRFDYRGDTDYSLWASEYKLDKPDPYPIKTYIDYGLDREMVKEEFKTDPLGSLVEFMGSLGPGEFGFMQILVQAARKRKVQKWLGLFSDEKDWKDEGKDLINKILKRGGEEKTPYRVSEGENDVVKAIERGLAKTGYDCGLRMMYLASKDAFKLSNQIGLSNSLSPFSAHNMNKFKTSAGVADPELPWLKFWQWIGMESSSQGKKREMFRNYRSRAYYYPPYVGHKFILTTEELATIYHFPGGVITTPTLERIESSKSEAPGNLPI